MSSFRIAALSAFALVAAAAAQQAAAQSSTFPDPIYGGYPVAYCGIDPESCGEAIANAWCRTQSYDFASEWAAKPADNNQMMTVRMEDGQLCRGGSCEAFAYITCARNAGGGFRVPKLGAAGRATLIDPGRRATAVVTYQAVGQDQVLVPGCNQSEPGIYTCGTAEQYQHCRSLMGTGHVHSCRAGVSFADVAATPVAATPDQYSVDVQSTALVRVERGRQGAGRARGEAVVNVSFATPTVEQVSWCARQSRYVFHTTGPKGGTSDIGQTVDCDAPVSVRIEPSEDDVLVAYQMCDSFVAWGGELTHSMELVVAGLFEIGSASPAFRAQYGSGSTVIAPYAIVRAPLRIECRE